METEFTKGEWIVGVNHEITDSSPANNCIATVEIWDQCPWVSNANLSLIAAAPDMYKALESHLSVLDDLYPSNAADIQEEHMSEFIAVHNLINKTKALLTKARGE